jgi:hypothetical protein
MYCINCGNQIPGNGRFCAYCGTASVEPPADNVQLTVNSTENEPEPVLQPEQLSQYPQTEQPAQLPQPVKKEKSFGKITFAICLVIIFGLSVFCGIMINMISLW